jgi:hypothetical protein
MEIALTVFLLLGKAKATQKIASNIFCKSSKKQSFISSFEFHQILMLKGKAFIDL